jgi:hypothetical protein
MAVRDVVATMLCEVARPSTAIMADAGKANEVKGS